MCYQPIGGTGSGQGCGIRQPKGGERGIEPGRDAHARYGLITVLASLVGVYMVANATSISLPAAAKIVYGVILCFIFAALLM